MRGIIRVGQGAGNGALGPWRPAMGALVLAAALKGVLLYAGVVPFNADEAVVGLMARHILQGERPIFFYGQAYLGSLDTWLIAGAFALFGQSVFVIRSVQAALYLATIVSAYWLGLKIYGNSWIASATALLLAMPAVLVTLYTTATLGGYGEVLLIGNVLFLLALRLGEGKGGWATWLLFGLLGGIGFWGFPLIVVYLFPALVYLLVIIRKFVGVALRAVVLRWALAGLGFVVGAAPWLWFTFTHGLVTLVETGGAAIAGASFPNPVFAAFQHLFNFLLFGLTVIFGLRPPWGAQFLALPLVPFALAMDAALVAFIFGRAASARDRARAGRWLLIGCCATLVAAFVLTPFGADPSGRYFLPLAVPVALFMAEMLHTLRAHQRRLRSSVGHWFVNTLALGVVAFNLWGTVQSAAAFPPGLTTQFDIVAQVDHRYDAALIQFLRAHGEARGYSNYWVEFPLAFLSQEELIYEARLPYHEDFRYTPRDNRYAPYSQAVAASPRAAYITTRHPALDERIRTGLTQFGVSFREEQIGDFHVFYALSRKVVPEELGLGTECC